jgi:hypothetical protein
MKQFNEGLNTKRYHARPKLTVKFWLGGRAFVDDIMTMINEANLQLEIKVCLSDILNFLLIREIKTHPDLRKYAQKIAVLSLKNIEVETKYLKRQPLGQAQISSTLAEPINLIINDLVDEVGAILENQGSTKSVKPTTIVQKMVISLLKDLGKDVDNEEGLAKLIMELFESYNYNSLIVDSPK